MIYMSAKNIQAMAFTHIMAILTLGRSVEDHFNLSTEKVCKYIIKLAQPELKATSSPLFSNIVIWLKLIKNT